MSPRNLSATGAAVLLFAVAVAAAPADDTTTTTTDTTGTSVTTETATSAPQTDTTTTTTATMPTPTASTPESAAPPVSPTSKPSPQARRAVPRAIPRNPRAKESVGKPLVRRRHEKRRRISKPLRVTPPLGQGGYVFPVVGAAGYADTYGAFRGDVHGKWHHGTDIFAPLGTPIVAVASGTVNRVGWRRAGGWRVWVRDRSANQFYYAHLAGYASTIFHSRYVEAGQVIGFVGNTGDAFPGPSHLHFEIHPHQLLRLRYDGAVDPTGYLGGWDRVQSVPAAPHPKHPALTMRTGARRQAKSVYRRLLIARDLVMQPKRARERVALDPRREHAGRAVAGGARPGSSGSPAAGGMRSRLLLEPLLGGIVALTLFAALVLVARLASTLGLRRAG